MRMLDSLTQRPLLIFGVLLAGFLAWVVTDATDAPRPSAVATGDAVGPGNLSRMRAVGTGLHQLHAGMSRAQVEAQVGRPSPRDIRPVERANGRVVYRTHYQAFLEVPLAGAPSVQGQCDAILEFDAAVAGHPVLRVTTVPVSPRVEPAAVPFIAVA